MKWDSIETFFLDMDGTILDLAFDNYFWHDHIPRLYSIKNKISFNKAKIEFEEKYKKRRNTIEWYSLKFWSNELDINLDNELVKTKNRIKIFPGVYNFLNKLKKHKINVVLITNCPREMLNVKFTQAKLWGYFNIIISSEDFGCPKEEDKFWKLLESKIFFDKNKTVFIDDNVNVLECASKYGINHVFGICCPDSSEKKQIIKEYLTLDSISQFEEKFID